MSRSFYSIFEVPSAEFSKNLGAGLRGEHTKSVVGFGFRHKVRNRHYLIFKF